jgi:hypothetical protein
VATAIGYDLTRGVMKVCKACAMAKAKHKNVPKTRNHEPTQSNGHGVFLDIATIKKTKNVDRLKTNPTVGLWSMNKLN